MNLHLFVFVIPFSFSCPFCHVLLTFCPWRALTEGKFVRPTKQKRIERIWAEKKMVDGVKGDGGCLRERETDR